MRVEFRPQLQAPACTPATFPRSIEPPVATADWWLASLQLKLVKIATRVRRLARAITFQRAAGEGTSVNILLTAWEIHHYKITVDGRQNKSTGLAGAPSNPHAEPSAKIQQLEEMQ